MNQNINWGIIGLGNIALRFAEAFQDTKNSKLKAISSKNPDKMKIFQKKYNINEKYCFNEYEQLLRCEDIDVVYIALPNSMHTEWIKKSINSKKNILVEKPAFINLQDAEAIQIKLIDSNLFFTEGFMYRYTPLINKVIEIIKKKTIGKPTSMISNFGVNLLTKKNIFGFNKKKKIDKNNRLYSKELGGGSILDLGCYPVSFSCLIASIISEIDYDKIKILDKKKEISSTGVDINSSLNIKFDNEFISQIKTSFSKNLGTETIINGSDGVLRIANPWLAEPPNIILEGKINKEIKIKFNNNIYSYEIDAVSKNILEKKIKPDFPGVSINETIGSTKILSQWLN